MQMEIHTASLMRLNSLWGLEFSKLGIQILKAEIASYHF